MVWGPDLSEATRKVALENQQNSKVLDNNVHVLKTSLVDTQKDFFKLMKSERQTASSVAVLFKRLSCSSALDSLLDDVTHHQLREQIRLVHLQTKIETLFESVQLEVDQLVSSLSGRVNLCDASLDQEKPSFMCSEQAHWLSHIENNQIFTKGMSAKFINQQAAFINCLLLDDGRVNNCNLDISL